jgi:hypothetical protein
MTTRLHLEIFSANAGEGETKDINDVLYDLAAQDRVPSLDPRVAIHRWQPGRLFLGANAKYLGKAKRV